MNRLRYAAMAAGLALLSPAMARAQSTVSVTLTAPNAPGGGPVISPNGQYYESPYTASVDGQTYRVNCVDFFHDVVIGEVWKATNINLGQAISDLSLLAYTRNGNLANALSIYEQVAWLTDQYTVNPASDPARTIAIQTAIWAIANTQPGFNFLAYSPSQTVGSLSTAASNTDVNSTGYWMGKAQTSYLALESTGYYDKFQVLTDVNFNNPNCQNNAATSYTCTAQEFVYSTPEPGTLILLGTGFAAVAGRVKRRKRKGSPEAIA